jgi:hypothetical protein
MDTSNTALPITVTARSKPTGGAATTTLISTANVVFLSSTTSLFQNGDQNTNYLPRPLYIRPNEGVKIVQVTSSLTTAAANFVLVFANAT